MFDWANYLVLAKELAVRTDEASKRAAVSRAYYAAFGVAYNYVESHKLATLTQKGEDHAIVWNALSRMSDRHINVLAQDAKRLRQSRRNADYVANYEQTGNDAQYCVLLAEAIVNGLR